jgi:protein-L-isoaspartate(D-aspartate) O-methyltransferase
MSEPSVDTQQTLRARQLLVQSIALTEQLDPPVLEAMLTVPRHIFVPASLQDRAYEDGPLPIGGGQTISQPTVVAMMTQALQLKGSELVLEVGTGSGYQAAVLSRLCRQVHSLEVVGRLVQAAREALARAGCGNVQVHERDGYAGLPELGPFDAIIITAAPPELPQALVGQLRAGGRMVVPLGPTFGVQELLVLTNAPDGLKETHLGPVRFVPMVRSGN